MKRTDFSQLQGIESTKRAIEICLAGYHELHILSKAGNGNTTLVGAILNITKDLKTLNEEWVFIYNGSDRNNELIEICENIDGKPTSNYGLIKIRLSENPINIYDSMRVIMPRVLIDHYFAESSCEASQNVVHRVSAARYNIKAGPELKVHRHSIELLKRFEKQFECSIATIAKIHAVANTIARLDYLSNDGTEIMPEHMAEAIQYFVTYPLPF